MAETKRRARGEDSIYYDRSRDRWAGTITVGWKPDGRRDRIIVRGRTKTEVKDKLRTKHLGLAAGIRTPANYSVEQSLKDWLETLNTQAESTVTGYRIMIRHLIELIGSVKLVELKVRDVDFALGKLAKRLSTRSVRLARMILIQAIPTRWSMTSWCETWRTWPPYPQECRAPVEVAQPGAGPCRAGRSQGRATVALRRREHARRHPHRGSPRPALVRSGP